MSLPRTWVWLLRNPLSLHVREPFPTQLLPLLLLSFAVVSFRSSPVNSSWSLSSSCCCCCCCFCRAMIYTRMEELRWIWRRKQARGKETWQGQDRTSHWDRQINEETTAFYFPGRQSCLVLYRWRGRTACSSRFDCKINVCDEMGRRRSSGSEDKGAIAFVMFIHSGYTLPRLVVVVVVEEEDGVLSVCPGSQLLSFS